MNNKLKFSDNCIEINCERGDTATQELIANFYPVHHNRINTIFKLSPRLIPEVLEVFRPGVDYPEQVLRYYSKEIERRRVLADLLAEGPTGNPSVTETLTLMRHQQLGREIAETFDRFAFFFDTRTGKTPLSISIINDSLQQFYSKSHYTAVPLKWLVVCPLILIENAWIEDFTKFAPHIKVINCHASTKAKRIAAMQQEGSVYITNTESFVAYKEEFEKMNFYGCVVDESSSMKSNSSKVTQVLVDFSYKVKRWYILSGTPAPNGEWEYYNQLQSLDYYSVPQSYTQFKEHFFINLSFNAQYEKLALRPDKKDELYAILKKYSLYVDKEDVLTTPGRTFYKVEFDMPADLKAKYTDMKNDLYVELVDNGDERKILAGSVAAKLNKLNQISSGFVMDTQAIKENKFYADSNLSEWYLLDDYRFTKLQYLLESNLCRGEQVLIWANYRKEFEIIQSLLGEQCRCIYGGTTINEKNESIRLFKSGKVQYLIANPASADKGLTLTNCHICIYFSLNWSYELFKQSMERIYGDISKQPKHCEYYVFIAKGTVDRILYSDVLQGKADASYAVLNHLKGQ